MRRMHKPVVDPKTKVPLPPEKQDKRSVVVFEPSELERRRRRGEESVQAGAGRDLRRRAVAAFSRDRGGRT